ncbi:MAG: hypothetical protein JRJ39_09355, partial [Deltaproteobacteria bacterium]|nr:hypothetical protein [Deltaproteobacteria bacterium]
FSPVVSPPEGAKSDLEILGLLSEKMEHTGYGNTPEKVRKEMSRVISIYSGTDGDGRSVWIKETDKNKNFLAEGREEPIKFSPVVSTEDEDHDDDYSFTVVLGPLRFHLGSGTRTAHSSRISEFDLKGEIEISPDDCKMLGLTNGDRVKLVSKHGTLKREIRVGKDLSSGLIFLPLAFNVNDAMNLIGLEDLFKPDSGSWNVCRAKIEKV